MGVSLFAHRMSTIMTSSIQFARWSIHHQNNGNYKTSMDQSLYLKSNREKELKLQTGQFILKQEYCMNQL